MGALLDSQISPYMEKKWPNLQNLAKLAEFCLDWTNQTRMGVNSYCLLKSKISVEKSNI